MRWTLETAGDDAHALEARLSGDLTATDLRAFVVALAARVDAARARRLLVDAGGLTSTRAVAASDLRGIAATVMHDPRLRVLRVAVVAPAPDAFGLGRMLISAAGGGPGIAVFRTREPATRFLAPSIR